MTNNKTITILSGVTVTVCGDWSGVNGDGIVVNAGGTLIITGTLDLDNNFTLTANGEVSIGNISLVNNGTLSVSGTGSIEVSGDVSANNNSTISIASGGSFDVDGDLSIATGSIAVDGTLNVGGTITGPSPTGVGIYCSAPAPSNVLVGDYVWKGVYSTDWMDASNWAFKGASAYTDVVAPPTANDNVIIPGNTGCNSQKFPTNNANTTYSNNLIIETGASFTTSTGTHNVAGDWTNYGTYTCGTGTIEFNGASNSVINGTNTFYTVTINKGSNTSTILDVNGSITQTNSNTAYLNFTSGLLRISTGGSWTKTSAGPTISTNSGLHVNGGTFTLNGATFSNNGLFKVTTGTANIGSSSGNCLNNSSSSSFILNGAGTLNIAGRFTMSGGSFNQSDGTINVCQIGNTHATLASFDISSTSTYTVTGGSVVIVKKSSALDVKNISSTVSISGGNLYIGSANTGSGQNFSIQGSMRPLTIDNTTNSKTATIVGSSTIYGNVTINSTSSLVLNSTITATVNGNLTNSGTFNNSGTLNIQGNWVNNNTYTPNSSTVVFTGSSSSSIGGTGTNSFYNLTMNKSVSSVVTTLASALNSVTNSLNLTSGILDISTYDIDMLSLPISNASAASYIRTSSTGVLKRNVGASDVLFPIGNAAYNPTTLNNSGTSDKYGVRVIDNVTDDGTGVGTATTKSVINRTWMISEEVAGESDVTLSLNWNSGEGINNFDPIGAFIAHYESGASMWDNIGGTVGSNTINSSGLTSFSPFTISSEGSFAPLPVELIGFQVHCNKESVVSLTWQTASEHNSNYFRVDRSRDGENWSVIETIGAAGQSNNILEYAVTDYFPQVGINYYRLTQYDMDGAYEQYNVQAAICNTQITGTLLNTSPNPSIGSFQVDLQTNELEGDGMLQVVDMTGNVVYSKNIFVINGTNLYFISELDASPGIYYVTIKCGNRTVTSKHSLN